MGCYREFPAPEPVRELVECGWSNAYPANKAPVTVDILPDGCMDLVWTGHELVVAGPDTGAHPFRHPPGRTATGLRFAPGRLPALLGVPAVALRDLRVPLSELNPTVARLASARLAAGGAAIAALTDVALALPGSGPEPAVAAVVRGVRRGRSAAATADELGWTTRSLHRHCLEWFGYGPSVLSRVLRFRHAVELLQRGTAAAEVAARAGYADQSHLAREVRALAGRTPGQLVSGANRSTPLPSGSCTTA